MAGEFFEAAFEQVKKLSQDFDSNKGYYLSPHYQESEVRKDFIDKFFIALGWDVNHETQKNPFQQEVKVERGVIAGQSQRRADYAFYTTPNFSDVRLFAEAKKPFGDLCTADNCFQTIRYGWNANVSIAILTTFEEFIILDCRYKPDIETVTFQIIKKYHFSQYHDSEKFAEIYYLFSRDAVAASSLEKYAETFPKRRGKAVQRGLFKGGWQPVDESFLEELDGYRDALARNFKNHNPELDGETLTEVTQRTLDRLVFLRFLEDKLIEQKPCVSEFGDKGNAWGEFSALCRRLDHIYDGIVFKKHDILDAQNFKVDDTQFADLCEGLAHVNSPYDFNFIPIHILGSIYERFLGKVIVVTKKRAHVEEKPEVRKAGGVYYTPDYIVRYIVDNTAGRLIAGKSPIRIAAMRFADVACGSGSFLLALYDLLLRYHRDWYNKHSSKAEKAGCIKRDDGYWHLSLQQKREILLNNIYGVDIDHQAVEVAQLSLYLKLLEEETTASAHDYQLEFHETLLPSLANNVKQGNSLIASDFSVFPEDLVRVHAFDWPVQFPAIMKAGGFDAIVGNPPWGALFDEPQLAYLREQHRDIIVRMVDSYMYFVHESLKRLRNDGAFGMILPDVLLYQTDSQKLRKLLAQKTSLAYICNMGNVFKHVIRPACIVVFIKKTIPNQHVLVADFSSVSKEQKPNGLVESFNYSKLPQAKLSKLPGCLFTTSGLSNFLLWERVNRYPSKRLADLVDEDGIQRGVSPDLKEAFLMDSKTAKQWKLEKEKLRPVLTGGKQVKRYDIDRPDLLLIYTRREDDFRQIPNICSFIEQFKKQITCKEVKLKKHSLYSLHRAREERIFIKPQKLLGVITEDEIVLALDNQETFVTDGLYLFATKAEIDSRYVMGILNSKLFVAIYRLLSFEEGRVLAQVKPAVLANLPIRTLDHGDPAQKYEHDQLVALVDKMLALMPRLRAARADSERYALKNAAAATNLQIDQLVYKLYGLSENEINIVDSSNQPEVQFSKK